MNSSFPPLPPSALKRNKNIPLRVLIVDDYEDNRLMLKLLLERQGVEVFEATNGQEAIEVACAESPHLILMDLTMPVMDGLESTRQLKQIPATSSIPVIAVSALCNTPDYDRKALEAGCVYCLGKPIEFTQLLKVLAAF